MNQTEAIELLRNAIESLLDDIEDHRGTAYGEFDTEEQAKKALDATEFIEAPTSEPVAKIGPEHVALPPAIASAYISGWNDCCDEYGAAPVQAAAGADQPHVMPPFAAPAGQLNAPTVAQDAAALACQHALESAAFYVAGHCVDHANRVEDEIKTWQERAAEAGYRIEDTRGFAPETKSRFQQAEITDLRAALGQQIVAAPAAPGEAK